MKSISQIKLRIGQGKADIKRKMLKFPVSQLNDKSEQLKLMAGRMAR